MKLLDRKWNWSAAVCSKSSFLARALMVGGVPSGSLKGNRSGGVGGVGGGGGSGGAASLPMVDKVCVDEQVQTCTSASGPTSISFGLQGMKAEMSQPNCITTIKTTCTTKYSSK